MQPRLLATALGWALLGALSIVACNRSPAPAPPAAEQPSPSPAAPSPEAPAAPAPANPSASAQPTGKRDEPPLPVPLSSAVAIVAGKEQPLSRTGTTLIDPLLQVQFRIDIAVPITDGRFALLDEQNAMVSSTGENQLSGSSTHYTLTPEGALIPGTKYRLRVDGSSVREIHDAAGRAYLPLFIELKTTGERPPTGTKSRRGRHRR